MEADGTKKESDGEASEEVSDDEAAKIPEAASASTDKRARSTRITLVPGKDSFRTANMVTSIG